MARRAEVGIGTLYRHFPTGVALLQAVYRHEVDALIQRGADLQTSVNRAGALRDDVTSADHAGALLCPPA